MIFPPIPVIHCMHMLFSLKFLKPGLLFICLLALSSCEQAGAAHQIDWQAPGFEISDINDVDFSFPEDLEGPTIILFWASWCPYCKALMPHLQSILDEYPGQVQVLALNFKDDDEPAVYMAQRGYDFRLILHSEEVAQSWGVKGTPGLFLADRSGLVVFNHRAILKDVNADSPKADEKGLKHYQKAARAAPLWAARLRVAIDGLRMEH
jgi:cytochrome c biogenesis protein CcmG/thiol:disulfide interchange protein DsbE